ncbi:MAG: hypothetical protein QXM22_03345 [Candidatus Bathyarchaeia archaeon]
MMKPAEMLYWSRAGLGVTIGVINALYDYFTGVLSRELSQPSINDFLTGLSFALLFFLITYYILKIYFINKIEKKTKILSTGIGAYFFLWLVVWVLLRSVLITTL